MNCRAVHLTSVHFAFDTRIFHKECKSLAMAGCDVSLVAPHAAGNQIRDQVRVIAVPPPGNRAERMSRTVWSVYRAALAEKADVYHFHDPELMPIGVLLSRKAKVIYDVHEDYSATLSETSWIHPQLRKTVAMSVGAGERAFSKFYDGIVAATPTIAAKFPPGKTHMIRNFPWRRELCLKTEVSYQQREPIAVYVGRLANDRGLREMVSAVNLATRQVPLKLVTAGEAAPGSEADLDAGSEAGLVEHQGLLGRSAVAELMSRARIGLAIMHPLPSFCNAYPTKLYEYMAAGLPVIASDLPICRRIVESTDCGLVVDPLNPSSIADALIWLLRHSDEAERMGRNGQQAVQNHYNWEQESERLLAIYAGLQNGASNSALRRARRSEG